jgi:hypothetical protein
MQDPRKRNLIAQGGIGLALLLLVGLYGLAQVKPEREVYQARVLGQMEQSGQAYNVTINIEQYSTPEERQILFDAFNKDGSKGLSKALGKMKSKGQIEITGHLGSSIAFARKIPTADGVKIRVLTTRRMTLGSFADSTLSDYDLTALELVINDKTGKGSGVLIPACLFKMNKDKEIEIEAYRNRWTVVDIVNWSKKKQKE